jgi:hypothetical protein
MPMTLVLRRAQGPRPGGWDAHDYGVLDDGREVGRIYRINAAPEIWWWGMSFMLTGRKRHDATAVFQAEHERWMKERQRRRAQGSRSEAGRGTLVPLRCSDDAAFFAHR